MQRLLARSLERAAFAMLLVLLCLLLAGTAAAVKGEARD